MTTHWLLLLLLLWSGAMGRWPAVELRCGGSGAALEARRSRAALEQCAVKCVAPFCRADPVGGSRLSAGRTQLGAPASAQRSVAGFPGQRRCFGVRLEDGASSEAADSFLLPVTWWSRSYRPDPRRSDVCLIHIYLNTKLIDR
jgi:hypothetical protein